MYKTLSRLIFPESLRRIASSERTYGAQIDTQLDQISGFHALEDFETNLTLNIYENCETNMVKLKNLRLLCLLSVSDGPSVSE
jgi:hypothetical protein